MPKGYNLERHTHTIMEQHFVLEDEYESENEVFGVGSYRIFPAYMEHGPFYSKNGALIPVIWDPVKQ